MANEIRNKFKRFTEEELDIRFSNWREELSCDKACLTSLKPLITNFYEFDSKTKEIYLTIFKFLKIKNFNQQNLRLWATGSRVNGRWRTENEAESWAYCTNTEVRFSDYDYVTNAKIIPSYKDMCNFTKANVENVKFKYRDVLVEIPNIN